MTYHHTPGHPVADIYEKYLKRKEFWQGVRNAVNRWNAVMMKHSVVIPRPTMRPEAAHAEEHPIEAEEGWVTTPPPKGGGFSHHAD